MGGRHRRSSALRTICDPPHGRPRGALPADVPDLLRRKGGPPRGFRCPSGGRTGPRDSFRVITVELRRVPLGRLGTPSDVLRTLRHDARPFLLVGDWAGGGAIAG